MRSIFITILLFVFCFVHFSQTNEEQISESQQNPKFLAEFNDRDNEWYKITAELIGRELINNSSAIGVISVRNSGDNRFILRLKRLQQGITFNNLDASRIILLIVDKQDHDTNVSVASDCSEIPKCKDCIVVRAVDINKIKIPAKPKTITKTKKKK